MRPIKYRLWNGSSMEPVGAITFHTDGSYHVNDEYPVNDTTMEEKFGGNKYYLMQFTGLLDRNGKEIFEGDILVVRSLHDGDEHVWLQPNGPAIPFAIKWDEQQKGFHLPARVRYAPYDYEIIGNIYETPELLK